ncbi:MAG: helicase-exonuclease AddAB subunit AddB [Candidatus Reconcilbacillus cellulovorans]|uniref:Helicase-exonuclease AddAB subunit AddB n=1 Tax=Candidatus Reconcilbacillus cellulovorans TaxID=1906605 RepID=A0A2A6E0E5_9BACL|nr:MAG: helicase-exonuclease AddAB subunit AddB [Candidatus Reconcilbacillus cellulovorans]
MGVRFVLGRAGSGKTAFCLDEIRGRLLKQPDGPPLFLVVPEQASFEAERAIVSTPGLGGSIRAQVLGFRRLAWRILQETGGVARVRIDETGKVMLIDHFIQEMGDTLYALRACAEQPGYLAELAELFSEFRRYGATADRLAFHLERCGLADGRLLETLRVYEAYERHLAEGGYADVEDDLRLAAAGLQETAWAREAEVWVDGFTRFTPPETALLVELMRRCRRVTVTLCAPEDRPADAEPDALELFAPPLRTLVRLKRLIAEAGVALEPPVVLGDPAERRFRNSPMLAELERLFEYRHTAARRASSRDGHGSAVQAGGNGRPAGDGVLLIEASDPREEAEAVAREIVRLARDEGYRYRDMAVLVRRIDDYADWLRRQFEAWDIPFFLDDKPSVASHPLAEFVRSALDVVLRNWPYEAVFRCVKTGFLTPPDAEAADEAGVAASDTEAGADRRWRVQNAFDRLENYVLESGMRGSRWTDGEPWRLDLADGADDERRREEEAVLNECRQWVATPLATFANRLRRGSTARQMAEALFSLLEDVRAVDRLERWAARDIRDGRPEAARRHEQVWDRLIGLLDQLVEIFGDRPMSAERFTRLVEAGLAQQKFALVPPSVDQVLVVDPDRGRPEGVRVCFIVGAVDGVWPGKRRGGPGLLSEGERNRLAASGLELADDDRQWLLDEPFRLYAALALPSERLVVSWPRADAEGRATAPADFVRHLRNLFPGLREMKAAGTDADGGGADAGIPEDDWVRRIAHPSQALAMTVAALRRWTEGADVAAVCWNAYNWFCAHPAWRLPLERLVRALTYDNREEPLDGELCRELFGNRLTLGVSRLERYAACPFAYFAEYVLRLRPRRLFRLEAPDVGKIFHAALQEAIGRVGRDGGDWAAVAGEEMALAADEAIRRRMPGIRYDLVARSPRYRYLAERLRRTIRRVAGILAEHGKRGAFVPLAAEFVFGRDGPVPPLVVPIGDGRVLELTGRIDRVDVAWGDGFCWLRVMDYKSGLIDWNWSEVYYGTAMQLAAYLDVLVAYADRWLGMPARPAGAFYFRVYDPLVRVKNEMTAEQLERERLKRFRMKGLVLADPDVVRMMDAALSVRPGRSDIVPVGLKADGRWYAGSSVADEDGWNRLFRHVRGLLAELGSRLARGRFDVAPYRFGRETACDVCPYRAVCQFDPEIPGNRYRDWQGLKAHELWAKLAEDGEDKT